MISLLPGWLAALALLAADSTTPAAGDHTLQPHPGYRHVAVPDLGVTALIPDGWRYTVNQGKLLASFAIIKEVAGAQSVTPFATGLTVYAVDRLSRLGGATLGQRVTAFAQMSANASAHRLLMQAPLVRGSYKGVALRYLDSSRQIEKTIYREYLADEAADRLLIVTFESPTHEWQQAWRYAGQAMVERLLAE